MASVVRSMRRAAAGQGRRSFATNSFEHLASYPRTQLTTLKNGIRVATENLPGQTATVGVYIDTGSRWEDEKTNGVAHFLEHMIFKGTERRSRVALETEVENIGGHLNAYTGREQTAFYAKVLEHDVPQAMDILSDIIQHSKLDARAVEAERGTILREMQEVEANTEELLFDYLHYTAYRGTSLARTILGPKENIRRINREDLLRHIKSHYTGNRMVVVGAGPVKHEELVKLTEKLFAGIPAQASHEFEPFMEPAKFTGSDVLHRDDSYDSATIAIAYPTAGATDPDHIPLMVAQYLLGSWDRASTAGAGKYSSSRMVRDLASSGVARSVSAFSTSYKDTGLFGVQLTAEEVGTSEAVDIVCENLAALSHKIDPNQLEEAKILVKMNLLNQLDTNLNVAEDIGRQMLSYGRRMHPLELIARIDSVDVNAVQNAARRFLYDHDHALAAIGNLYELPSYERMRRKSYFIRY